MSQVIGAFEKKIDQKSSTSNEDDQVNTFYDIQYGQKTFVVKTLAELKLTLKNNVKEELTGTKFDYKAFHEFLIGKRDRFEDKQLNLVASRIVLAQKTTESDEKEDQIHPQKIDNLNHEVSEKATKKDNNETSLNGNDSQSVNDDNNKHPVNEYGSSQLGSELAKNGEEINVISLYQEAYKAYKPPGSSSIDNSKNDDGKIKFNVKSLYEDLYEACKPPGSSSIDNSKNDDGKIKILKQPYEPIVNDLIIHVRSQRGIEIWTKVKGSFSNEKDIPMELLETTPVSTSDRKLNKLAIKNLHRHLQGLIAKDEKEDKLNFLSGLTIPDFRDPVKMKQKQEMKEILDELETSNLTERELPFKYGVFHYDLSPIMSKAQFSKPTIDYNRFLLAKVEADENEIASGGAHYLPSTTNDPSVPKELNEKNIELLNSEVETNSEEKSTINNYEVSSQDASNNQERPRAPRNECSKCGRSFVNEMLLQVHEEVRHTGRSSASEEVDRLMDSPDP